MCSKTVWYVTPHSGGPLFLRRISSSDFSLSKETVHSKDSFSKTDGKKYLAAIASGSTPAVVYFGTTVTCTHFPNTEKYYSQTHVLFQSPSRPRRHAVVGHRIRELQSLSQNRYLRKTHFFSSQRNFECVSLFFHICKNVSRSYVRKRVDV